MSIADIDAQIAELEKKKRDLIAEEKKTAKKKVELALAELNALGFHYKLVQTEGGSAGGGGPDRRTGVRDDVLKTVAAGTGMKPADIAEAMGMTDKRGKTSIANALSNLKKAGKVKADNGLYTAV